MKDDPNDLLRRQHGVISRSEAVAAGLSNRQIQRRVEAGIWIVVHPGVFRHASHPVTPEQQILAAVRAAGPGAVASHQAAAYLWGLLEWRESGGRPAVTVQRPANPRSHGFDLHRVSELDWTRVRHRKGIECTDLLWTLASLGAGCDGALVDRAIDRALAKRLLTVKAIEDELAVSRGTAGEGWGSSVSGWQPAATSARHTRACSKAGPWLFWLALGSRSSDRKWWSGPRASTGWTSAWFLR